MLKQGAKGLLGYTETENAFQPGLKVPVRDLTGAGDSVLAAVDARLFGKSRPAKNDGHRQRHWCGLCAKIWGWR